MRKLGDADRQRILEYVGKEPEVNLFISGAVENFGVDTEDVSVYANERDDGQWDSLLLRYFDDYIFYSQQEQWELEPVVEQLGGSVSGGITGKASGMKRLAEFFPDRKLFIDYLSCCNRQELRLQEAPLPGVSQVEIRRLTPEDARRMMELYLQIEEFAPGYRGREEEAIRMNEENLRNGGTAVGAFVGQKLISSAIITAATPKSGMIIAVATLDEFRGRGIATEVVGRLCKEAFEGGKEFLCLFYKNPAAGRIYKRMGFTEIGQYGMLNKK